MTRPRLYAHRGASEEAPENTLPAFERALELGADALELDVHATRDGVLVVSHDPSALRMAGISKLFRDATWEEVRSWDAAVGFRSAEGAPKFVGQGVRVPSLEEVLTRFPETPLNVDLKAPIAELAVPLVHRLGAAARVCLTSFERSTLRRVRALGYRGPTGLSRPEVLQLVALPTALQRGAFRPAGTAAQVPVSLVGPGLVARCHALGLRLDVWTVNDPLLATRLAKLGVDGIMTDDPRRIRPALGA